MKFYPFTFILIIGFFANISLSAQNEIKKIEKSPYIKTLAANSIILLNQQGMVYGSESTEPSPIKSKATPQNTLTSDFPEIENKNPNSLNEHAPVLKAQEDLKSNQYLNNAPKN